MSASVSISFDFCCCIDMRCLGDFPYVWLETRFVQEIKGTFRNVWADFPINISGRFFAIMFHRRCGRARLAWFLSRLCLDYHLLCLFAFSLPC